LSDRCDTSSAAASPPTQLGHDGICIHHADGEADQKQEVPSASVDQRIENVGDGFCVRGSVPEIGGMPLGKNPTISLISLAKDAAGCFARIALLIFDRITVWRRLSAPFEHEERTVLAGQMACRGPFLEIRPVDDLAEEIGEAASPPPKPQISRNAAGSAASTALPCSMIQAANQDRGAIGVVGISWKFGHPRSLNRRWVLDAFRAKRNDSWTGYIRFFKQNKDLHRNAILGRGLRAARRLALAGIFHSHVRALRGDGLDIRIAAVQSSVARIRRVSAIMVMMSPGLRGGMLD